MKTIKHIIPALVLFLNACTSSTPEEKKEEPAAPLTQVEIDSVVEKTGNFPARTNARAEMDEKKWVSTSFGINVFNANGKRTYAIFLTDGSTKIAMNYSGPEAKGVTNTGDFLQASIIDANSTPYPCNNGMLEFTQFDTVTRHMSGSFKLYCAQDKDKSKTKNITNATFTDLTWK